MVTNQVQPENTESVNARIREACERRAKGISPTLEERREAAARIDRIREANAVRLGVQDVVVDAVRQLRKS